MLWAIVSERTPPPIQIILILEVTCLGPMTVTVDLFEDFDSVIALATPCVGSCSFFTVGIDENLLVCTIDYRVRLPFRGPCTFVECTQLCHFPQAAKGVHCVFKDKQSKSWSLGVISGLFPLNNPPIAQVYRWNAEVSSYGIIKFAEENFTSWNDVSSQFSLVEVEIRNVDLKFVNQI